GRSTATAWCPAARTCATWLSQIAPEARMPCTKTTLVRVLCGRWSLLFIPSSMRAGPPGPADVRRTPRGRAGWAWRPEPAVVRLVWSERARVPHLTPLRALRRLPELYPGGVIDLHPPSTASDGTDSPARLVEVAARAGVTTLALTDHDTTSGWAEAAGSAAREGVALVRGAEISAIAATDGWGTGVHLLAYLHDPAHPDLLAETERTRDDRESRA